jgi:hypothetical protein
MCAALTLLFTHYRSTEVDPPSGREATDDDIKRCDADGNPTLGGAQPADVRRCSVIGDGEGDGDGVT